MGLYETVRDYVLEAQMPGALYRSANNYNAFRRANALAASKNYLQVTGAVNIAFALFFEIDTYALALSGVDEALQRNALTGLSIVGIAATYRVVVRGVSDGSTALLKHVKRTGSTDQ